ncbi:MAG: hypothetical protein LBU39_06965 [Desulfobulbaceae bacterium]|jgi:rubrerythrin/uncharacterized membrane protein|nr:hypothetical protein [Desulfobulbaceae bacterium]
MKEWKCEICGYIHEGAAPPGECPICKASKENFSEQRQETAKHWRCASCGYIHEGAAPPERCPLCASPKEKFAEQASSNPSTEQAEAEPALKVAEKPKQAAEQKEKIVETPAPAPQQAAEPAAPPVAGKSKRWRCLVCGYTHEGAAPPDKCPICKAPAKQFAELDEKGKPINKSSSSAHIATPVEKPGLIAWILMGLHVHPILAHFPNGILPMVVLFLTGSVFFGFDIFVDDSTFYSMAFVLITMPFVLGSGFLEWKKRYRGARTVLFATKIFCSLLATGCLTALVLWRFLNPEVMLPDSPFRIFFFIVAVVMLLAVALAGHLGGHLVFKSRGR